MTESIVDAANHQCYRAGVNVPTKHQLPAALKTSDAFLLGRLRTKLVRLLAEEHERLGLRLGAGTILICLADLGPMNQRDMADLLDVDPGSVVRVVDQLEERGLAERRADAEDRRRNLVTITQAGRKVREEYGIRRAQIEETIFGGIGPEGRAVLRQLLAELIGVAGR